jgi:mRNA interferase MazF
LAKRSSKPPYCPDAGDVVWIDFDPQAGREISKRRPGLVLSPRIYNVSAELCVVCAMTSKRKGRRFEVVVADDSVVVADQIRTMSWRHRRAEFIHKAAPAVTADVRAKLKALLGIV